MTVACISFAVITVPKIQNKMAGASRATAIRTRRVRALRASAPLKKFGKAKKIFEDQERGIVCYGDENGELICEGCDEGPRYEERPPEAHSQREVGAGGDFIRPTDERLRIIFEESRRT